MSVDEDPSVLKVNSLAQLRLLVTQDEDGFKAYLVPKLSLGNVWWIPDIISGFGEKQRHPWVIVKGYSTKRAVITACPRSTTIGSAGKGILTPAGVLRELTQPGQIILTHRRTFVAKDFRGFDYIGQLPADWIQKIRDFNTRKSGGK